MSKWDDEDSWERDEDGRLWGTTVENGDVYHVCYGKDPEGDDE